MDWRPHPHSRREGKVCERHESSQPTVTVAAELRKTLPTCAKSVWYSMLDKDKEISLGH